MRPLWAPWRMAYVGSGEPPSGCFVCDFSRSSGPPAEYMIERTDLSITVLNRFPYSSGHLLIAPRRHLPTILELTDTESAGLLAGARRATQALTAAFKAEGFNLGINQGVVAGASIEHVHLHVVPRWAGDTNFMPVLGDVKVLPEHLTATAERLRDAFAGLGPP